MKFILLVVASLLVCANAGPIPDDGHNIWINGIRPEIDQTDKEKPITVDDVKNKLKRDFEAYMNKAVKVQAFKGTIPAQQEDMTVIINVDSRKSVFGNKIDVAITSNGTETDFTFRADVDIHGITVEFETIEVVGTINGKEVNEKGKIMYKWDKVRLTFIGDIMSGSKKLENLLVSETECVNPSIITKGLSEGVVKKIEDFIALPLKESWAKLFGADSEKETKYGKSQNACKLAKWTTNP